jgi:hypothetical protein
MLTLRPRRPLRADLARSPRRARAREPCSNWAETASPNTCSANVFFDRSGRRLWRRRCWWWACNAKPRPCRLRRCPCVHKPPQLFKWYFVPAWEKLLQLFYGRLAEGNRWQRRGAQLRANLLPDIRMMHESVLVERMAPVPTPQHNAHRAQNNAQPILIGNLKGRRLGLRFCVRPIQVGLVLSKDMRVARLQQPRHRSRDIDEPHTCPICRSHDARVKVLLRAIQKKNWLQGASPRRQSQAKTSQEVDHIVRIRPARRLTHDDTVVWDLGCDRAARPQSGHMLIVDDDLRQNRLHLRPVSDESHVRHPTAKLCPSGPLNWTWPALAFIRPRADHDVASALAWPTAHPCLVEVQ